jgi:hypothetical protein
MGLLGISLDPKPPNWSQRTCCNPFTRPFAMADEHPAVLHAAAVKVCGLATKLADDSRDEGVLRRGLARIGGRLAGPATDRAIARLNTTSFPTARVMECLDRQDAVELANPLHADEPTATAYGTIVSHLADLLGIPGCREPLQQTGRALGSLVYWRDAWTDRMDDAKRERFNPFANANSDAIRQRVEESWQSFSESLGTLPFRRNAELVGGVLKTTGRLRGSFLELRSVDEERAEKKRRKRERKSERSGRDCCDCYNCCDCCDCCHSCKSSASRGSGQRGCCDAACDCGPGDTGCCDCNPCDGCDCCP